MKVVLFCGGMGMRIREYSDTVPKPMVPIGYRPLLWHVMKYYAHFGHKDFILCLGYKADVVKSYFLNYDECVSNNFVFTNGGKNLQLLNSDIHDWNITFVDTGITSNIGQRLMAVRDYVKDEEVFLANYSDGLTDLSLSTYLENFRNQGKLASFLAVKPSQSYHVVTAKDGLAAEIGPMAKTGILINGGFFALRHEIFDYIGPGEELVEQPFQRLIKEQELIAYEHDGFWASMDTFKDKQQLEDMYTRGNAPWEVWKTAKGEVMTPQVVWKEPKRKRAVVGPA